MSSVSRTLAEWSNALRYEDLPSDVVDCAKRFLYDSIGCAFGGYRAEDVHIATSVVLDGGGNPQATLIGSGRKVSAVDASCASSPALFGATSSCEPQAQEREKKKIAQSSGALPLFLSIKKTLISPRIGTARCPGKKLRPRVGSPS